MNPLAERLKKYLQQELDDRGEEAINYYLMLADEENVFVAELPLVRGGTMIDMGAAHALAGIMRQPQAIKVNDDVYACLVCMDENLISFIETEGTTTSFSVDNKVIGDTPIDLDDEDYKAAERFVPLLKELLQIIRLGQEP